MSTFGPLVDTAWRAVHLRGPDLRLIDFRWQEGQPGRAGYKSGHIPGTVFVDLEAEGLSRDQAGSGEASPPRATSVPDAIPDAGVNRDSVVIAYDDLNGFTACRLWWVLRYFGHSASERDSAGPLTESVLRRSRPSPDPSPQAAGRTSLPGAPTVSSSNPGAGIC